MRKLLKGDVMFLCNSKKVMCFVLSVSMLAPGCVPTMMNVKQESNIKDFIPKEYPVNPTQSPNNKESQSNQIGGANEALSDVSDQTNLEKISLKENWKQFFTNQNLVTLIDTALKNNQELNIITQEINIANNEVLARKGEYLPKVGVGGSAGVEKVGELTSQGVSDANLQYEPGKRVPEKLPIYSVGLNMSWEIDIWKKLRNAKKSAALKYLSSIDGRNFMITQLVAEIANTYYELLALDKQLEIVQRNIKIQTEALELVELQKQAARVTSLAVRRFEAEVLKNKSRQYELRQKVIQTENKLNFLVGRFPQHIERNADDFINIQPKSVKAGVPTELLSSRPDVKRAERMLEATKLDVRSARARFYPSLSIEAGAGFEAFNSKHLFESPGSVFYNLIGNLTAPLLNRMAIKADYLSANSKQVQAVYDYERTVINAYTEVVNQLSMIDNMQKTYVLKSKQVVALNDAVEISNVLFRAARADYVEVLMTRRDALEAQMELIEIKQKQLTSYINLYQALGGGWQG